MHGRSALRGGATVAVLAAVFVSGSVHGQHGLRMLPLHVRLCSSSAGMDVSGRYGPSQSGSEFSRKRARGRTVVQSQPVSRPRS